MNNIIINIIENHINQYNKYISKIIINYLESFNSIIKYNKVVNEFKTNYNYLYLGLYDRYDIETEYTIPKPITQEQINEEEWNNLYN